jgi:hypothetical protein
LDEPSSTHGNKINAYRILVREPEGKRPSGRSEDGEVWTGFIWCRIEVSGELS